MYLTAEVHCRDRWRTIRDSYLKSLRTQKNDTRYKAKKKYYLADHLSFLLPFIKQSERSRASNLTANTSKSKYVESSSDTEDSNSTAEIVELDSVEIKEKKTEEKKSASTRPQENNSSATDEAFLEWLNHKQHKRPDEDSDELYVRSLVKYMKEMTSKQNRRFRLKVMGLIDEILDESDVEEQEKMNSNPTADCYTSHIPLAETIKQTHPVLSAMFSEQASEKPIILPQGAVYLQDGNDANLPAVKYVKTPASI